MRDAHDVVAALAVDSREDAREERETEVETEGADSVSVRGSEPFGPTSAGSRAPPVPRRGGFAEPRCGMLNAESLQPTVAL